MKSMCMNIPTYMCHMAFVDDDEIDGIIERKVVPLNGSDISEKHTYYD